MTEGLSTSGSVTVEKVEIINVRGNAADVTQNTSYIEIFEDIQNPFLTGNISFNDPVNLKDLGPLVGQEILRLKLKTDSMEKDDEIIDSLFFMYDLVNSTELNQFSRQHQYKFCSIEALENNRTRISRPLRGTFSDMVFFQANNFFSIDWLFKLNISAAKIAAFFAPEQDIEPDNLLPPIIFNFSIFIKLL